MEKAELRLRLLYCSSLLESKGTNQPSPGVILTKTQIRLFPSGCAARSSTILSNGFLVYAAPKTTSNEKQGECRGRGDGNFPFFKPEVMVATTMWPPLSGLTSRKWRKDQKQVEIKRIEILKFFCFATGCHPSSTYHSARQEHCAKQREIALEGWKLAPLEI